MRPLGFSSGVAYKILKKNSADSFDAFRACGATAVEVNCHTADEAAGLDGLAPLVAGFSGRSVHLPGDIRYGDDAATRDFLSKIDRFYRQIGAELAVVHPDRIDSAAAFRDFPDVRWAAENMDDRKSKYRTAADLAEFFAANPDWRFVLDVGHCNANDKTMKLADDLIAAFGDRISEIHLSGYVAFHDPLYRTGQTEIIQRCRSLNAPIIIESVFEPTDGPEGIRREFDYVLAHLA